MAVERISPADADVAALLNRARDEPLILQTEAAGDFAVLPLDDEILDLLLERSPRLRAECEQIRERMKQGAYLTHKQVLGALKETTKT
jgi:hypothetical protein